MNPLKISITGVRGIVGDSFTPHLVVQFTQAFGTYLGGGRVCVCDDARGSAAMVRAAVLSGLAAVGCEPVDFGVCPTPAMQYAVGRGRAGGGIAVSAGHNSEDWNALRFIRGDGMYLNAIQSDSLLDVYHAAAFSRAAWDSIPAVRTERTPFAAHLRAIRGSIDVARIKKRRFRVAVDTCNGACSTAAAQLLESLGCRVTTIHNEPGRPFPHDPEPAPRNMQTLQDVAAATDSHIGFMTDTAGERLGLVTESGEALSEETTLPLCVMLQMETQPGVVAANLSTTRAIDDLTRHAGGRVVRTLIGQAHVAEAALKHHAVIAGEGSGGVIIPAVHNNADALATMAFILHHLARRRAKLSTLVAQIPKYHIRKIKIPMDFTRIYSAIRKARAEAKERFKKARFTLDDGVKVEWPDAWLHVRPSNTESLIRIIAEAKTQSRAEKLLAAGAELIE